MKLLNITMQASMSQTTNTTSSQREETDNTGGGDLQPELEDDLTGEERGGRLE